jgi:hypothetical protein
MMFEPRVETVATPLPGFLSYVPEAQAIREAALAAFAPIPTNAVWPLEADPYQEEREMRTLLADSTCASDNGPLTATVHLLDELLGVPTVPTETEVIDRAADAETTARDGAADSAAAVADWQATGTGLAGDRRPSGVALEPTRRDVLADARLLWISDQQQQEARTAACRAEEAWVRSRYCPHATKEELKAANRARLAARRVFAQAREEYLATSQVLCRTVERMVEQEAALPTVASFPP